MQLCSGVCAGNCACANCDSVCRFLLFGKVLLCACRILFRGQVYHGLPNIGLVKKFVAIKGIVFFTVWQAWFLHPEVL